MRANGIILETTNPVGPEQIRARVEQVLPGVVVGSHTSMVHGIFVGTKGSSRG